MRHRAAEGRGLGPPVHGFMEQAQRRAVPGETPGSDADIQIEEGFAREDVRHDTDRGDTEGPEEDRKLIANGEDSVRIFLGEPRSVGLAPAGKPDSPTTSRARRDTSRNSSVLAPPARISVSYEVALRKAPTKVR